MINYDVDLEELFYNNKHQQVYQRHTKGKGSVYPDWFCFSQLVCCVKCLTFSVQHLVIFGEIFIVSIHHFGVLNVDIYFLVCRIYFKILLLVTETFCVIVFLFVCLFVLLLFLLM